MTVVILYLTSGTTRSYSILGRVTNNKYLYSTARAGGRVSVFFCLMVGGIDSFIFTSHTYFVLFSLLVTW